MNDRSVIVTGGAGFIGRAVVSHCLAGHFRVVVYDNLCVGKLENLKEFKSKVDFIDGDILNYQSLEHVFNRVRPWAVFHLAAHHFIPFCNAHPQETMRVNVEGTYAVLAAAAAAGAEVAVVASSGVLYPSLDRPLSETDHPAVDDVYGLSKLLTEQAVSYFADNSRMRCVTARLFNTYGPFETNAHLIPHIFESCGRGSVVELGNIHTKRDYIYVDDVANALVRLAHVSSLKNIVVNVGTGREYSASEIVNEVSKILKRQISIRVSAERVRASDKLHQIADVSRLKMLTSWMPKVGLSEGLRHLAGHCRYV